MSKILDKSKEQKRRTFVNILSMIRKCFTYLRTHSLELIIISIFFNFLSSFSINYSLLFCLIIALAIESYKLGSDINLLDLNNFYINDPFYFFDLNSCYYYILILPCIWPIIYPLLFLSCFDKLVFVFSLPENVNFIQYYFQLENFIYSYCLSKYIFLSYFLLLSLFLFYFLCFNLDSPKVPLNQVYLGGEYRKFKWGKKKVW